MNRRQVLTLLGSAGVGGCLGGGGSDGPANTTRTTTTTRTTETDGTPQTASETTSTETTEQTTAEQTMTAEPPEIGEPLPSECPVTDDHVQRVVCYPGTDAPLVLTPSSDGISLPTGSISFTLANETDATFETNYYGWSLHKRVDGEWYHVAPGAVPEPAYRLSPGESHAWNMKVDNSNLDREIVTVSNTADLHLRGLSGGTYAFGTDGWFQGQEYTKKTAVVARFRIEGDRISLSRTDSVESVERDGETKVVKMPEAENPRQITVTRIGDPPEEPERVITEQVIRTTPLRNALAVFEEEGDAVQTVRVENATLMVNFTLALEDESYVEYRGTTYRVERERQETTG